MNHSNIGKKITKIVTFYDDGTFTEFTPSPGYTPSVPYQQPYQPYIAPYPWPNPWYSPSGPNTIMCNTSNTSNASNTETSEKSNKS